jgi:GntR family transcriptional regulator
VSRKTPDADGSGDRDADNGAPEYIPTRHVVVEQLRSLVIDVGKRGLALPGEPALARRLGVGRATLRDALTRLETEGLILRRKGADTVVNPAAFGLAARIDLQADFAEILRDCGFEAEMVLLESERTGLSKGAAAALEIEAGAPALRTLKRWHADGQPVMAAVDWIPLGDNGAGTPDPSRPVFQLAAELGGEDIAWEVAWPGAVAVRGQIAKTLQLRSGSAVWTLERVGIGLSGRRSFFAFEYHVPSIVQYGFIRSLRRP